MYPRDYVTSHWSGGTTTQLAISPEGARYTDRDFLWRISSAIVTVKESDFTLLPDYHRLISVLEGDMKLAHNGGEPVVLRPGDVHTFAGGDETHASGCCTDFNLMLRRGQADGRMEAVRLCKKSREWTLLQQAEAFLLYCVSGSRSEERRVGKEC